MPIRSWSDPFSREQAEAPFSDGEEAYVASGGREEVGLTEQKRQAAPHGTIVLARILSRLRGRQCAEKVASARRRRVEKKEPRSL